MHHGEPRQRPKSGGQSSGRRTNSTAPVRQAELARHTGLSTEHIDQIIRGKDPAADDTARRLERATGVPERLWNSLESRYQEHQARLAGVERL